MLTLERPMSDPGAAPTTASRPIEFRCRCGRYLGRWINGVLHEPNGNRSGLPVVRRCPDCGKWHRRLVQHDTPCRELTA